MKSHRKPMPTETLKSENQKHCDGITATKTIKHMKARNVIMKHKNLTLMAVAMSIVLSLSACGGTAQTDSTKSTESVMTESTKSVENSTEAFVPETELSTEESVETTEATESVAETVTETQEPVADEAVIDVKTVSETKTTDAGYTYSEVSKTMYAKSTVNVRSLPSTSGSKLGSLSKNQEVAVTGQCNETGWYRINYNNGEGFVSNKYLADEPVAAAAANVAQAQTGAKTTSSASTGDPVTDAAIAKYGPNIMIANDGTIYSTETWQQVGTTADLNGNGGSNTNATDGFDRAAAEQVWAYVNEERTAAGLNAVAWDENAYNFACQRAQAIVTNFSHEGCGSYYENILLTPYHDAYDLHMLWQGSPKHYANYMNAGHVSGACAVYTYNGTTYAVEEFVLAYSPQTDSADPYAGNQTREVNGTTQELTGAEAKAYDEGTYWTASNGITVYITGDGTTSTSIPEGRTMEEAMAAVNEYLATH